MFRILPRLRRVCLECQRLHSTLQLNTNVEIDLKTPARTRFAPSPTGRLHLGSLRTALFNYLFAKRTGGQFILRIEDTDVERTIGYAEQSIYDDLRWATLNWDEGPNVGGPYGPYKQSDRVNGGVDSHGNIYKKHAQILIDNGHAYRCFCSPEELAARGQQLASHGLPTSYDGTCLRLEKDQSDEMAEKQAYAIRFKDVGHFEWDDLVFGLQNAAVTANQINKRIRNDFILLKRDGWPTYHLASVVDDWLMKITHVIRGSEWLKSTPKHLALYTAFGWAPPRYAHTGLLRDIQQNKLSKRDLKFDLDQFKRTTLPEALNNFLALLGWKHHVRDGERNEVYNMRELIDGFDLRLSSSNPMVVLDKLQFLQSRHLERKFDNNSEFAAKVLDGIGDSVRKMYTNDDLVAVGIDSNEQLLERIRLLVGAAYFKDQNDWAQRHAYAFCNRQMKASSPVRKRRAIYRMHVMTERFGLDEQCLREIIKESFADRFGDGQHWSLDDIIAWHRALMASTFDKVKVEDRNTQSAEWLAKLLTEVLGIYLRQWIAWGEDGTSVLRIMHSLGFDLSLQRIENGRAVVPRLSADEIAQVKVLEQKKENDKAEQ